jgi:hypothetical protein
MMKGIPMVISGAVLCGPWSASAADFAARCAAPGVVKCVGFENPAEIAGGPGGPSGSGNDNKPGPSISLPQIDPSVSASGTGSLKFTVLSGSPSGGAGFYWTNFSDDFSVQFGANSEFYIQWRQRFSRPFLDTVFLMPPENGWKQAIISTGDKPGCTPSSSGDHKLCVTSCQATELVPSNMAQRGFAQLYNSCTGSTSHRAYDPFNLPFTNPLLGQCYSPGPARYCWDDSWCPTGYSCSGYGARNDYLLTNGQGSPYCTYLQGFTQPKSYLNPGNCFGYFPDEWMTFQIRAQVGSRLATGAQDEFVDSHVDFWIAREGQPSIRVYNWGPYALSAGRPIGEDLQTPDDQKYGKIWFTTHMTGKDVNQVHPTAYTWYDDLIISRNRIADPYGLDDVTAPAPPSGLQVR